MIHNFLVPVALATGDENSTETSTSVSQAGEEHGGGLTLTPEVIGFQALNFLILLFILHRVLYKPLIKLLNEREKKIREGIENAEKADLILKEASLKRDDLLKKARVESQFILEKGIKAGEERKAALIHEAQQESARIIEAGHRLVEQQKAKAAQEIQKNIVSLLVKATEKVLKEKIDAAKDGQLIQESIQSYS